MKRGTPTGNNRKTFSASKSVLHANIDNDLREANWKRCTTLCILFSLFVCVIYWQVQQSKCRMTFLMTEYQIGHIGNDRIPTFLMTEYQIDCISIDRRGGVYARSSPIFFQRKIIYVPRGAGADSIAKRVTCFPESWWKDSKVPRGAGADSTAKRVTCFPESW